jgi:hypothetical protein
MAELSKVALGSHTFLPKNCQYNPALFATHKNQQDFKKVGGF